MRSTHLSVCCKLDYYSPKKNQLVCVQRMFVNLISPFFSTSSSHLSKWESLVYQKKGSECHEGQLERHTENVRMICITHFAFMFSSYDCWLFVPNTTASDPQFDTAAQRSWAYGVNTKPTIAKKTRVHNPKTSLPGFGTAALPTHGRRAKSFTNKKPRGIFNE